MVFLALLAASSVQRVGFGAEFSLAQHALGARADELVSDSRYECESASACFLFTKCARRQAGDEGVAGVAFESVVLYITGERLTAVQVQFAPSHYEAMATALSYEYGQPVEPATRETAELDATASDVLTWRQGRRVLHLARRVPETGRASLILSEENFLSELLAH